MDFCYYSHVGRTKRVRPKSIILAAAWFEHREALEYDWMTHFHAAVPLLDWDTFSQARKRNKFAHTGFSWLRVWQLTRQLLRDHMSHIYMSFNNWSYTPTPLEEYLWTAKMLSSNTHGSRWRPWHKTKHDPLEYEPKSREEAQADRAKLMSVFHISGSD